MANEKQIINGRLTITLDINSMSGAGYNAFAPPVGEIGAVMLLERAKKMILGGERNFKLAHPRETRSEGNRDVALKAVFKPTKYKTTRFTKVEKF